MGKKYIKKYYYKKGKWSANIDNLDYIYTQALSGNFFLTRDLAKNPTQNSNSISQQYTIKNVEINFEISSENQTDISSICLYIMYVPQGMQLNLNFVKNHPEYIMAYRFLGRPISSTTAPGRSTYKIKSRLSRRLQTGDSIVLIITGYNNSDSAIPIYLSGVFRWWSKAN